MIALPENVIQRRPLVSIDTAAYLRDCPPDDIREQIENGQLIAFDLRLKSNSAKSLLRILARSLNGPVKEAEVLSWLPPFNPTASQLPRLFSCSAEHVRALVCGGALAIWTDGKPRGLKQSPRLSRESILKFLQMRRIGFKPSRPAPVSNRVQRAIAPHTKNSDALHTVGICPDELRKT